MKVTFILFFVMCFILLVRQGEAQKPANRDGSLGKGFDKGESVSVPLNDDITHDGDHLSEENAEEHGHVHGFRT